MEHPVTRHAIRVVHLALFVAAFNVVAAAGKQADSTPAVGRVTAVDPGAQLVLAAGMARSHTFRTLVETLEESDAIVYVETRQQNLPGQLQLAGASDTCRLLRISLRAPAREDELVGWLAHELWHAIEIAREPEVTDQVGLVALYRRIGWSDLSGEGLETEEARVVQLRVLSEVAAVRAGAAPVPPETS